MEEQIDLLPPNIYMKIQEAKKLISNTEMKKAGWNDYSKYNYFLPEQVKQLVDTACFELNLFTKFDLIREAGEIKGVLQIVDINSGDKLVYEMATAIPEIKATNAAQQLGGTMTFTERYLKMTAFGIADNTLDFDSKKPEKEEKPKLPVIQQDNTKLITDIAKGLMKGYTMEQARSKYTISKEVEILIQGEQQKMEVAK